MGLNGTIGCGWPYSRRALVASVSASVFSWAGRSSISNDAWSSWCPLTGDISGGTGKLAWYLWIVEMTSHSACMQAAFIAWGVGIEIM